jgi:hypothetical protein
MLRVTTGRKALAIPQLVSPRMNADEERNTSRNDRYGTQRSEAEN